jgi:hypothetical protein
MSKVLSSCRVEKRKAEEGNVRRYCRRPGVTGDQLYMASKGLSIRDFQARAWVWRRAKSNSLIQCS